MNMNITVGLPSLNRKSYLINTINSLIELNFSNFEIIVIDQSDNDKIQYHDIKTRTNSKLRIVYQDKKSLTEARNRIINLSESDIILFLDDDIVTDYSIIDIHYLNHKTYDVIVGRITQKNGWKSYPFARDYLSSNPDSSISFENYKGIQGGNFSIKKNIFNSIGFFDTNFSGMALREETDLYIRLKKNGIPVYYCADAHLLHLSAPSGGCRRNVNDYSDVSNITYFIRKNFKNIKTTLLLEIFLLLRSVIFKTFFSNNRITFTLQPIIILFKTLIK